MIRPSPRGLQLARFTRPRYAWVALPAPARTRSRIYRPDRDNIGLALTGWPWKDTNMDYFLGVTLALLVALLRISLLVLALVAIWYVIVKIGRVTAPKSRRIN